MIVTAAFQHVRDNMDEINYHVKAKETDIIFLKTLMDNPTVESLIKVSLIYWFYEEKKYDIIIGCQELIEITKLSTYYYR